LQKFDSHSIFSLQALISGIEKDAGAFKKSIEDQRAQLGNVSQMLEQMAGQRAEIGEKMAELDGLRAQLAPIERKRARREISGEERQRLQQKVVQLEAEANKFVGKFDAARLEAQRAIEAANVYKEVEDRSHEITHRGLYHF
jgi:chromosome segregation ATPase